jgi:hypothetical protein
MEDAGDELRRGMRSGIKKHGLDIKLPSELQLDPRVLISFGIATDEAVRLGTVKDLFRHFQPMRNAIAHSLITAGVGRTATRTLPPPWRVMSGFPVTREEPLC